MSVDSFHLRLMTPVELAVSGKAEVGQAIAAAVVLVVVTAATTKTVTSVWKTSHA